MVEAVIDLTRDHENASFPNRSSYGLEPAAVSGQIAFRVKHADGSQTNISCSWKDTLQPKKHIGLLRYYNPVDGRWINRDPIEEKGGINLFEFLGNNSVGNLDPTGHEAFNYVRTPAIPAEETGHTYDGWWIIQTKLNPQNSGTSKIEITRAEANGTWWAASAAAEIHELQHVSIARACHELSGK